MQAEEDKANRLGKLKIKLENTIAETNDELEREKRLRGDVEKVRRKLEADIKVLRAIRCHRVCELSACSKYVITSSMMYRPHKIQWTTLTTPEWSLRNMSPGNAPCYRMT